MQLKNRWKTVRSPITRAGAECCLSSHAMLASDNFIRRVGIKREPDAERAVGVVGVCLVGRRGGAAGRNIRFAGELVRIIVAVGGGSIGRCELRDASAASNCQP